MTLRRRDLLAGGAVAVIGVGISRPFAIPAASSPALPAGLFPADRDTLILHDGRPAGAALVRAARTAARHGRISNHVVAVLAQHGFARTVALLDRAKDTTVIALLDDGEALVIEALLKMRGAQGMIRLRHDGQALLSARL